MSSETLLFDLHWREDGRAQRLACVARMAPAGADVPVFQSYDLAMQAQVIRIAGQHGVPTPRVRWVETDPAPLGAPFFVMERLRGRVPADVPPYLFEGWLRDATTMEQRQLQDATIAVLAKLHAIDVTKLDTGFLEFDVPGATPLARHLANQRRYFDWVAGGEPHPLLERSFDFLEANWPDENSTVISWGDARIGNIMYDGFEPLALFDWEMAGIGPREIDIGWLIFIHSFFQDLFGSADQPPMMQDFLRAADVAECYQRVSGHRPKNLRWYITYAALRHGVVMTRIAARMQHFGQSELAADPDARFPHRALLEAMLDGSYWRDCGADY